MTHEIFPLSKEIYKSLRTALTTWTTRNSLPSLRHSEIEDLWTRSIQSHQTSLRNHITHKDIIRFKRLFPEAIFHNEDKRATSLRIFCPMIYYQCLTKTFADPMVFRKLDDSPNHIIENTIPEISKQFGKTYPWALGAGRDLPNAYVLPKRKKQFLSGRPIVSFFTAPFRPMLNCIAKLIYHLLLQAFPHNLAKGDVFDLIKLLKNTDFDTLPTPQIYNQDLAGFFTSIDTDRFLDSWRLILKYLSSTMSTEPDEIISVKATTGNMTGDVVKGRTCRTLNVTRKIFLSVTSNASSSCLWRWPSSPSAPLSTNRFVAHPWVPLSVLHYVWWSWLCLKKFGTKRTIPRWPQWTCQLAYFSTLTTDYAWQTHPGAMRFRSPTSSIRSSTATLLSLRRNQTKNSWVFVSSSNLLPCVIALHVTLSRSWHHFRHLCWMFNFLASCLDCSWSPNARTLRPNEIEVLLHCTVCTKLQDFRNLTWCQHPNRFDVTSMSPRFGEKFSSAYWSFGPDIDWIHSEPSNFMPEQLSISSELTLRSFDLFKIVLYFFW